MAESNTQFRLWHLFEATAWCAIAAAIWTQVDWFLAIVLLPYLMVVRFLAWDLWHREWQAAVVLVAFVGAGLVIGLAVVAFAWLSGGIREPHLFSALATFMAIFSWVGAIAGIVHHPWWPVE